MRRIAKAAAAAAGPSDGRAASPAVWRNVADETLRWSSLYICRGRGILRGPGKVNALSGTHPGAKVQPISDMQLRPMGSDHRKSMSAYIKPLDVAW
jgi:hypothetical protein